MFDFDSSYLNLIKSTKPKLNLQSEIHRKALLKWLNEWGCRQFSQKDHSQASKEIEDWYNEINPHLIPIDRGILSLTDDDFALIETIYSKLVGKTASERKTIKGNNSIVTIGPTGTSKILFALRPHAMIPWDEFIREKYNHDGSANSYCKYLQEVKGLLEELSNECKKFSFSIYDLPRILNRPESTLVKLIDEYHWVTISRNCHVPDDIEFGNWVAWR